MALYDDLINDSSQKLEELKELVDSLLGGNMATQEEIKNAIIQALEESASRFLSGQGGNVIGGIEIDTDGHVVIKPSSGVPDDPDTIEFDETEAAKMGGTISIARALEKFFDKCDSLYGTTNGTPTTAEATVVQILHNYFPSDKSLMQEAIANYYLSCKQQCPEF